MEVIEYNEKVQSLSLRYSTHVVWKYRPVSEAQFAALMEAEDQEKFVKNMIHYSGITGTYKEDM